VTKLQSTTYITCHNKQNKALYFKKWTFQDQSTYWCSFDKMEASCSPLNVFSVARLVVLST